MNYDVILNKLSDAVVDGQVGEVLRLHTGWPSKSELRRYPKRIKASKNLRLEGSMFIML